VIRVQAVTKTYESASGVCNALGGVDLEIGPGEFVAVVGKSGSGKSTLLNIMAGIDRPSSGSVVVGTTNLSEMPASRLDAWRGRTVGIVFQFFQLLPTLTALENVMLPMDFCRSFPARQRRQRALMLLERLGVADQAGKLPATLSGGQQQRVAIARALANDPSVILADEPTGNLDTFTGAAIFQFLTELSDQGKTVVVVTHERDLARSIPRTVKLEDGKVVAEPGKVSATH
jgi:putative ABC transport system ATP-binding protein